MTEIPEHLLRRAQRAREDAMRMAGSTTDPLWRTTVTTIRTASDTKPEEATAQLDPPDAAFAARVMKVRVAEKGEGAQYIATLRGPHGHEMALGFQDRTTFPVGSWVDVEVRRQNV